VNGYAFLTGDGGNAGFELTPEPLPSDLATAFAEAQTFEGFAQTSFTDALTDFAAGNEYLGLVNLSEIGINSAYATRRHHSRFVRFTAWHRPRGLIGPSQAAGATGENRSS
jgi:hypothetical protein